MTLSVGFYYERYRFYTAYQFDTDTINFLTVLSGNDNNTDQTTSNNQTITLAANNEVLNVTGNT